MPLDIPKQLTDRLWTLLEGRSGFTSAVGLANRIKTAETRWADPQDHDALAMASDNLDDFPNVRIFVRRYTEDKQPLVFQQTGVDYTVRGRAEMELRIVSMLNDDANALALEAVMRAAIRSGNWNLGLSFVAWWSFTAGRTVETSRRTKGRPLTITTLPLTVETSALASVLSAA